NKGFYLQSSFQHCASGVANVAIDTEDIAASEGFITRAQRVFAEKLDGKVPEHFPLFVERYFHLYPLDELIGWEWGDLFGIVYQWWQFIQRHDLDRAKIKVFNPNLDEHGWLSGHTAVVVLQRDMPFLVDSIRMEFNRRNIAIHAVKSTLLSIQRDEAHQLLALEDATRKPAREGFANEALIFLEINRHADDADLESITDSLHDVLREVEVAVDSYAALMEQANACIDNLERAHKSSDKEEVERSQEFLAWMVDGHYTFLGYREYDMVQRDGRSLLCENAERRMGTLRLS